MSCNHLTKNNQSCKIRVSEKSQLHNGMRLCHIHIKSVLKQENVQNSQVIPYQDNTILNTKRCNSLTKTGKRCSKKTSCENGMCHIHNKIAKKDNNINLNDVSEKIFFMIKSPAINYKTEKTHDNCYVCLEETEKKSSCGHFIHTHCLLNTLQSNIKKNYRVFEHNNEYFVISNCLYCKQISIMKNIPMTDKLQKKYDAKRNKMRINNTTVSYQFNELFLKYDTYETKEFFQQSETEFMEDLRQLIFDNFATIIFDNYILQKNILKIPMKYENINKNKIIENLNITISNTLYTKYLYDKIKSKLDTFFTILENVVNKIIQTDNVQDDILSLVNIF